MNSDALRKDADVIVIGGGASGMFCAALCAAQKLTVIIIEPNHKLGRKLRITGKGRCNVTNNCSQEDALKNVIHNPKFLYSCFSRFTPYDTMKWFEDRSVPLKTERGGRVFPVSDKADDIADAMEKQLKRYRVKIVKDKARSIVVENGRAVGVKCVGFTYYSDAVVLATGGRSYPATGSDGSGYTIASEVGHTITQIRPSLVPIVTCESFVADLCGLTLKNITLSLYEDKKKHPVFSELGEMTFMPYGISGPLTLSASCYINTDKLAEGKYKIYLDLKPGLSLEQLEKRIQRDFDSTPAVPFKDSLTRLLPSQIISTVVDLSGIDPNKSCNQVTRSEKIALAALLKRFSLSPTQLRPIDEAIITAGGVSVKEIDPVTMGSKLVNGLYFIGEIIDVDAVTGGYNLQIAFSTAFAASSAIIDKHERKDLII